MSEDETRAIGMIDISKLKMPEHPDLWCASLEEVEDGRIVRLHGDEVRRCQWTLRGADHWVVMESDGCLRIDWNKQDAQLAAAAPNLLAALIKEREESKRLREQLDNVRHWVSSHEDEHMMEIFKMWIGEEV